jgi:hypothetical protein
LSYRYLKDFLSENPNAECPKAGKAAYSNAIYIGDGANVTDPTDDDIKARCEVILNIYSSCFFNIVKFQLLLCLPLSVEKLRRLHRGPKVG